ncbi:unnamed protein product [Moneuplotes crassus]|uniref:protein-tyrosine-phosphatase n=1 Tax=Euplotes crassus TaxID=5936 RepID=A0AAD1X8F2_EUPCR|nr:unnamed protein product [Moneuplotes crassus]
MIDISDPVRAQATMKEQAQEAIKSCKYTQGFDDPDAPADYKVSKNTDKSYFNHQEDDYDDDTTDFDMTYQTPNGRGEGFADGYPDPRCSVGSQLNDLKMYKAANKDTIEIIEDKLYFLSSDDVPIIDETAFYFETANLPELKYEPYNHDFGPLKLSQMHRYCLELVRLLQDPDYNQNKIYHYCSTGSEDQANSVCLIGCFMIVILGKSADEAWHCLQPYHKVLKPYCDSLDVSSTYPLSIYDILCGLQRAISLGWYDYRTFDVHEYEYYEKVENGDLNWIIPNKIVALMGPSGKRLDKQGNPSYTPEDYQDIFRNMNVGHIVRLNKAVYQKERFTKLGFKFTDLYFKDGSTPSREIVHKFIEIVESSKKAIAVHCKAGLGRTGTLIGCYSMKNYGFTASEFIGWARLVRPGSVLGPQQHFLEEIEDELKPPPVENNKLITMGSMDYSPKYSNKKNLEMSPLERQRSVYGDKAQANRLISAKKSRKIET